MSLLKETMFIIALTGHDHIFLTLQSARATCPQSALVAPEELECSALVGFRGHQPLGQSSENPPQTQSLDLFIPKPPQHPLPLNNEIRCIFACLQNSILFYHFLSLFHI